jgi:hypothetical protein
MNVNVQTYRQIQVSATLHISKPFAHGPLGFCPHTREHVGT